MADLEKIEQRCREIRGSLYPTGLNPTVLPSDPASLKLQGLEILERFTLQHLEKLGLCSIVADPPPTKEELLAQKAAERELKLISSVRELAAIGPRLTWKSRKKFPY